MLSAVREVLSLDSDLQVPASLRMHATGEIWKNPLFQTVSMCGIDKCIHYIPVPLCFCNTTDCLSVL